jgi:hypothetical protein
MPTERENTQSEEAIRRMEECPAFRHRGGWFRLPVLPEQQPFLIQPGLETFSP